MEVLLLFILDFARIEQNNGRCKAVIQQIVNSKLSCPDEGD